MQNVSERGKVLRDPKERSSSASTETILRNVGTVSRRDFIYLSAALAVFAGTAGCSCPGGPPDERSEFRVLRPEDLLSLRYELRNLRIVQSGWGPPRLIRIDDSSDAFLVIQFPGQHVAEEVFNEAVSGQNASISLPVRSKIAQPTQLVFRVPFGVDFIELSLQSLLEWDSLEFQTPNSGLDGQRSTSFADRSRIELPVGLALAPDPVARWAHAARPVTHNGRIELWHTQLAPAGPDGASSVSIVGPGYTPEVEFETSLTNTDRRALIGKSAMARTLILSPMGGWLDVRGRWEAQTEADLSRWEQVATAGQDQRVVVERKEGFLYPFGHRATVMSVTERAILPVGVTATRAAVLRKRDFVVIKEPQVTYRPGEMALQMLTAQSLVTPALRIEDKTADAFWIETSAAMPYPFRFAARDWAEGDLDLDAPAVFMQADADIAAAARVYSDEAYRAHRQTGMRGQSAAVAKFEPPIDTAADGADEPLSRPRSAGDTTLQLLALAFAGMPVDTGDEGRRFRCRTENMLVRIPSLEPFLDEVQNLGWFEIVDPDGENNRGEVFARAQPSASKRIPMYFDQQADRSGGIAAPSFDVDGLSRIHGPVGNAELVMSGGALSGTNYFNADHATLLGGFPLASLLQTENGAPSPAIPRIDFTVSRKQPKEKDKPKKDPEAGDKPEPEPAKPAYWEVGLGLTWTVPLDAFGKDALVSFAPKLDDDKKSTSKLQIAVKATKTLGRGDAPAREKGEAPPNKSSSGVTLTASGEVTNFALVLNVSENDTLSVGFKHITVKLGPPKPTKKKEKQAPDEPTDDRAGQTGDKKKEPAVSAEVDFKLSEIGATGGLSFVKKVLEAAAALPKLPKGEAPTAYPAKMPGAGVADINLSLGPFEAPKFKLLQFDVSNVSVTLGIGLNFLPRPTGPSTPPRVPDNVFSIRVASVDKPLTLLAPPWGGIAHLGLNFTPKRLTGFQYSLGVVNKTEFDLGITKAKCESSLAAAFTYWSKDGDHYQLDLILKLSGQAKLWFMDIHLMLVAIGSWADKVWSFHAELTVRIQIGFFAPQARFSFSHEIADNSGGKDRLPTTGPASHDDDELTEAEWLAYRSAFAKVA